MKDLALFQGQESELPVAVASENAVLDAYADDDDVWVVFRVRNCIGNPKIGKQKALIKVRFLGGY